MARGRKAIAVDANLFQNIVADLERRYGFTSRNALWQKVAETGWAKSIGLTAQVAMLKAKAFNIVVATPLGKRGRSKGEAIPNAGKRKRKRRIPLDVVSAMKKEFAPSLHKKIDRAAAGSAKAAIGLKCVDCCAGSKKEVALCTCKTCPLYSYRPYTNVAQIKDESDSESEEVAKPVMLLEYNQPEGLVTA